MQLAMSQTAMLVQFIFKGGLADYGLNDCRLHGARQVELSPQDPIKFRAA